MSFVERSITILCLVLESPLSGVPLYPTHYSLLTRDGLIKSISQSKYTFKSSKPHCHKKAYNGLFIQFHSLVCLFLPLKSSVAIPSYSCSRLLS